MLYEVITSRQAVAVNTKFIENNPNKSGAYTNLGTPYSTTELYYNAIADYTRALELEPTHAEGYFNRGFAYRNNFV